MIAVVEKLNTLKLTARLLIHLVFLLYSVTSFAKQDSCQNQFDAWKEKYGSLSFVNAVNKSSYLPLTLENLTLLIQNKKQNSQNYVLFDRPLLQMHFDAKSNKPLTSKYPHNGFTIENGALRYAYFLNTHMSYSKLENSNSVSFSQNGQQNTYPRQINDKAIESREDDIQDNLSKLVKSHKDDELLIAFGGGVHLFNYFLHNPSSNIVYFHLKLTSQTKLYSEKMEELFHVLKIEDFEYELVMTYYSAFKKALESNKILNSNIYSLLFPENEKNNTDYINSKILFIADVHHVRDSVLFKDFPSPASLKEKGIKKIKLALEGFSNLEKNLTIDKIIYKTRIKHFSDNYFNGNIEDFIEKKPDVYSGMLTGSYDTYPALTALLTKMMEYELNGIPVSFVGFDSDNNPSFLF